MRVPLGIVIISTVSFILAALTIYDASLVVGYSLLLYREIGVGFFMLTALLGIVFLLLGFVVLAIGIGLLVSARWAVEWGAFLYGFIGTFSLFGVLFNPLMLVPAAVYLVFFFYLKKKISKPRTVVSPIAPVARRRPSLADMPGSAQKEGGSSPPVEHRPPPKSATVKVPDNMIICPQCQTLNLKADGSCKICATDLPE